MSFQFVIDKAATLSINQQEMVASTTARDGTTRVVTRGMPPLRIEVKVADGIPWNENRAAIEAVVAMDRIQTGVIKIPYLGFEWYYNWTTPVAEETYTVRCIDFPRWTIYERNQVSWSGPFVFEVVA